MTNIIKKILNIVLITILLWSSFAFVGSAQALQVVIPEAKIKKITVCHSTGQDTYNEISISKPWAIWHSIHGLDIIPPFITIAGPFNWKNWTTEWQAIWNNGCVIPEPPKFTIIADKIICDDESILPNWWAGWDDITENTVTDFLSSNQNCSLDPNWEFNLTYWDYSTTFVWSSEVELVDDIDKVTVSEVEQEWYIAFAWWDDDSVPSAEMYCYKDVLYYDNSDHVFLEDGVDTYNCVAFNVLITPEAPVQTWYNEDNWDPYSTPHNPDANEIACIWWVTNINWASVHWTHDTGNFDKLVYQRQFAVWTWPWTWNEYYTDLYTNYRSFWGLVWTPWDYSSRVRAFVDENENWVLDSGELTSSWSNTCTITYEISVEPIVYPEASPVCEDGKNYVKISLDDDNGWLSTVDNTIWFGDNIAPTWVWFELPLDASTSSHTEWAVITYNGSELSVDLLMSSDNAWQDFAWTIEFHWNWVTGVTTSDLQTTWGHPDTFAKLDSSEIIFDLAVTSWDDHWKIQVEDIVEYCPIVEAFPMCEDWKRYAKVTLDEVDGLNTTNWKIYYWNSVLTPGTWFELVDAPTSVQSEWAIITYENDVLTIDLLKEWNNAWQDFAWNVELYWASVNWALIEWTWDYTLEDSTFTHEDIFTKDWTNTIISFDFATTNANDRGSMNLEDMVVECPVSAVTLCKVDTKENPLEWWNLQLLWNHIEQVNVPVDSFWPTSSLVDLDNGNYVLVANWTYEYRWNSWLINDATFSQRLEADWFTWPYFPWINTDDFNTPWNLSIKVNNNWKKWSDYLAWDHKYAQWYENYTDPRFIFTLYDNAYSDNKWEMTVDIYNGYAWTTDENWCITFQNVPYWDYSVDETLMVEWDNVSWLWDVSVDEVDEVFTVVNKAPVNTLAWVEPICEDWKRYAKIMPNEWSGWISTIDDIVWFGNSIVPIGVWFELPSDETVSSHTEWAVLTYDNNILSLGLYNQESDERQDFAWTLEFYWAAVNWSIVEWTGNEKLEATWSFHDDSISLDSITMISFDLAVTTADDEAVVELEDNEVNCNDPFKIVASKIVCTDESELPSGFGFDWEIKYDTAAKWAQNHDSCNLVEWWKFQYWVNWSSSVPAWNYVWEETSAWWTTSSPTDSYGSTTMTTWNLENVELIKVREVLKDDFIPFSDWAWDYPEYSAEMYCWTDIWNYDNEEWINNPEYWQTVNCVAWNVPAPVEPLLKCENNFSVNNEKDLSTIDLSNWNQVNVNELAFGASAAAVDPVTWNVYYLESDKANPRLWVYNITNHTNTIIWYTNATSKLFTKAAFSTDGTLYAMTDYTNSDLYSINIVTAASTYIDSTPYIDKDWWDLTFDHNWDMYVLVKDWKFFKVDVTLNSTAATYLWQVKYSWTPIEATWLVYKNWLFYASNDSWKLYSFSLTDIEATILIGSNTNSINDLASCPATIKDSPETWTVKWYKWLDGNGNSKWENWCESSIKTAFSETFDNTPYLPYCEMESWIEWWNITLTSNWEDATVYNETTDEYWYYSFDEIPMWEYTLCEVQQEWFTQTFPLDNWCHTINVWESNEIEFNFGNQEDEIPDDVVTFTTWWGWTAPKAACVALEIDTDLWTSDGSVEITCRWNKKTGKFKLDCWNWTVAQIKDAIGWDNPYATFTCDYDINDTTVHTPVCSVSKIDAGQPLNYNWVTPVKCEAELWFAPKLTTFTLEEEIVAAWWDTPEEISEETDGWIWGWIQDTYDDYVGKMKKLSDIEDEEKTEWVSDLKSTPDLLLKTWTPISERVKTLGDSRVETSAKAMTADYKNDINSWKAKLPEADRNRSEYIVVPSNWLVVPVNYVPTASDDYDSLINWREIDVNKYLQSWVMNYPGTSSSYGKAWNKVIFGHSSYWKIDEWRYKTQFQKIIELDAWEEIWVYKLLSNWDFKRFVYEVTKSFETDPTNVSVLDQWVWSNLTLVTCTPIGWITSRWVVKAKYINEEKIELQNYVYGKNISTKYRLAVNNFVSKLYSLDKNKKAIIIMDIFSKLENIEESLEDNKKMLDVVKYLKLQIAINYNK